MSLIAMWLPNVLLLLVIIKPISSACATKSFELITCDVDGKNVRIKDCISRENLPGTTMTITCKIVRIDSLKSKAVVGLPNLRTLTFESNGIEVIESGVFAQLPSITFIYIHENKIEMLSSDTFKDIPVNHISLHRNMIKRIQKGAFKNLPKMATIDVTGNYLTEWQGDWFENTPGLMVITADSNNIKTLHPGSFNNFPKLRMLKFSNNKLCSLNAAVLPPRRFIALDISNNYIRHIDPSTFRNYKALKFVPMSIIDISENHLQQLPEQIILDLKQSGLSLSAQGNPWICAHEKKMQEILKREKLSWKLSDNAVCVVPANGKDNLDNYDVEASEVFFKGTGRKTCMNCCE